MLEFKMQDLFVKKFIYDNRLIVNAFLENDVVFSSRLHKNDYGFGELKVFNVDWNRVSSEQANAIVDRIELYAVEQGVKFIDAIFDTADIAKFFEQLGYKLIHSYNDTVKRYVKELVQTTSTEEAEK